LFRRFYIDEMANAKLLEFGGKEANATSRRIAEEHKAALNAWFSSELTSAGVANITAMTEELAML
jgi:hypothetical protein